MNLFLWTQNKKIKVERGFLLTCWHKIEKLVKLQTAGF